jgi:hypothetical protein
VGGHSRRVGKTSITGAILRAVPEMDFHAVKISSHRHSSPSTRSGNLLRLTDADFASGVAGLRRMLDEGRNVLAESNRIVQHLAPDLVIFAIDPLNPDWKLSSAACIAKADAFVFSGDGPCPAALLRLPRMLPAFRLTAWNETPVGFREWIRERLRITEVAVHEDSHSCAPARSAAGDGADSRPRTGQTRERFGAGLFPRAAGSLELV